MPSKDQITTHFTFSPSGIDRIAFRQVKEKIAIQPADPTWPFRFAAIKAKIEGELGSAVVQVNHAGSTSVPGLPAKDVIDIDLVVRDLDEEEDYVPGLEGLGFRFLFREPAWHGHRFFVGERQDDAGVKHAEKSVLSHEIGQGEKPPEIQERRGGQTDEVYGTNQSDVKEVGEQITGKQRYGNDSVNLHVWGPDCPEVERHQIFRRWLLKTPEDLELYAKIKREAAVAATEKGETMQEYNERKERTIQEILGRAFAELYEE